MLISCEQFIESISQTGLLPPAEVERLKQSVGAEQRTADADPLARQLVQQGKLTRYQAAALYQGKAETLAMGNYVILDKLGAGGMGQVFRARHRRMDRVVALKVLPKKALASPEAVARFQREVKAAAKLSHPNIVTAYDADEAGGVHFLVMEYAEGSDLSNLVKKQGPLPVAQALSLVAGAARGLEHAHGQGVVHRDIKPSNLLVDAHGQVKILDLGLARLDEPGLTDEPDAATAQGSDLTQAGSVMGTVDYMAPEQALDTHHADQRADIYSLGCTLYYLLTGKPPYLGGTLVKRLMAHREMPIPSLRVARPDVPEAVDALFRRMVAKRPENRPASMTELLALLEAKPGGAAPVAVSPAPHSAITTPTATSAAKGAGSRKFIIAGALAGLVPLVAVAVILSRRTSEPAATLVDVQPTATTSARKPVKPRAGPSPAAKPLAADRTPDAVADKAPPAAIAPVPVKLAATLEPPQPVAGSSPAERTVRELSASAPAKPAAPSIPAAPASAVVATAPGPKKNAAPSGPAPSADAPPASDTRLAVPDERAVQAALETARQVFKDHYAAARTAEGKSALAEKLMKQAGQTQDASIDRYALLCAARDLAADAGNPELVDQAITALAEEYRIQRLGMLAETYQKLLPKSRPTAANKPLAEWNVAIADQAVEDGRLDLAQQFLKNASALAAKARDPALTKQVKARSDEIATLARETEQASKAREKLAASPDDPEANLALGRHLCARMEDWEAGLTHLAKGSDPVLKELAQQSLAKGSEPAAATTLGDQWWEAAEKAKGKSKGLLRAGARCWYDRALPGLTGLVKTKVEQRLADLGAARQPSAPRSVAQAKPGPLPPPAVAPFPAEAAKKHQAAWAKALRVPAVAPNSIGMPLVLIPPGEFLMGSTPEQNAAAEKMAEDANVKPGSYDWGKMDEEGPQHLVKLTRPYFMGMAEVTIGQFAKFVDATKYVTETEKRGGGSNWDATRGSFYDPQRTWRTPNNSTVTDALPVTQVTWGDTVAFCNWLSEHEKLKPCYEPDAKDGWILVSDGAGYRLPTEAEWEYACRAGTTTQFSFGDDPSMLDSYGWFKKNSGNSVKAVGLKLPNAFGLFDMHGNVWERCQDLYAGDYYSASAPADPMGASSGSTRVYRGGSYHSSCPAHKCRSAYRGPLSPVERLDRVGFRVVRVSATSQPSVATETRVARATASSKPVPGLPRPAVAPFSAEAAETHQAAWAKALKQPVKMQNGADMPLVLIPPGEFLMGSSPEENALARKMAEDAMLKPDAAEWQRLKDEMPQHRVTLTRPYWLGATEVTIGQFNNFVDATRYATEAEQFGFGNSSLKQPDDKLTPVQKKATWRTPGYATTDDLPVTEVTWNDAVQFCNWLSEHEKLKPCYRQAADAWVLHATDGGYRLPTEAEWEFACRAGTTTQFSFGDDPAMLPQFAWYGKNAGNTARPAGSNSPNAFGVFDMHGNLREWCHDWYNAGYYASSAPADTFGPPSSSVRVIRGGSWNTSPLRCRSAFRYSYTPINRSNYVGFRVAYVP